MTSRSNKSIRVAVNLFLILALAHFHALGDLPGKPSDEKQKTVAAASGHKLAARLVARGNLPVLVNGHGAYTGATIFTGATIQTPGSVRATVQLGELGTLDLSPNTIATLDFGNNHVKGTLKRGCAILTTNPNTAGTLLTPDGTSISTEPARRSSVTACSGEDPATAKASNANPSGQSNSWISRFNNASTLGLLGAGGMFAVRKGLRGCCCCCCCGKNPSPSSPQDCGCP